MDNDWMEIASLAAGDDRRFLAKVAGPASLLVAKLHKLGERVGDGKAHRLYDKDAHDIYRLVVAVDTAVLDERLRGLRVHDLAGPVTIRFRHWTTCAICSPQVRARRVGVMAGRAEEDVGEPETVAASVAVLTADLLTALHNQPT